MPIQEEVRLLKITDKFHSGVTILLPGGAWRPPPPSESVSPCIHLPGEAQRPPPSWVNWCHNPPTRRSRWRRLGWGRPAWAGRGPKLPEWGGDPEWDDQAGVLGQAGMLDWDDLPEEAWQSEQTREAGWSDQAGEAQAKHAGLNGQVKQARPDDKGKTGWAGWAGEAGQSLLGDY